MATMDASRPYDQREVKHILLNNSEKMFFHASYLTVLLLF